MTKFTDVLILLLLAVIFVLVLKIVLNISGFPLTWAA